MNEQNIYLIVAFIIYIGVLVYSVYRGPKDAKSSFENYTRGKGTYSFLVIAIVMAVTMVGPADALALSQNGLKYGLIWAIFPIGAALSQFVTGTFFAGKIKSSFPNINSIGDIFSARCSKSSTFAAGSIAFLQSIAFSGVLILAGGQILESFAGIRKELGMIITALLVGGYTSFRGMLAVMKTDIVQGFFMGLLLIVLFVTAIILSFKTDASFWNEVFIKPAFKQDYNANIILSLFFGYFLGELLLPTYCIRASVSKDSSSASKGFKLASLILVIWYLLITYSGSLGQFILGDKRSANDDVIILDVIRFLTNQNTVIHYILGAFAFLVFISLIHSTFDSFLNNGAVSFSRDMIGKIIKLTENQELWVAKQATIAISVLGLFIAVWKNDLIDVLFIGYTVWVPTILASLIWLLLNKDKKLTSKSFWIGFLVGIVAWYVFEYSIKTFIPSILIGFVLNYTAIIFSQKLFSPKAVL